MYFPESESQLSVGLMSPTSLMTHTSANAEVSTIFLLICSCLQTEVLTPKCLLSNEPQLILTPVVETHLNLEELGHLEQEIIKLHLKCAVHQRVEVTIRGLRWSLGKISSSLAEEQVLLPGIAQRWKFTGM